MDFDCTDAMPGVGSGSRQTSGRQAQSVPCGRGKALEPIIGNARRLSATEITSLREYISLRACARARRRALIFIIEALRAAPRHFRRLRWCITTSRIFMQNAPLPSLSGGTAPCYKVTAFE